MAKSEYKGNKVVVKVCAARGRGSKTQVRPAFSPESIESGRGNAKYPQLSISNFKHRLALLDKFIKLRKYSQRLWEDAHKNNI
jgi:hypothetical protein